MVSPVGRQMSSQTSPKRGLLSVPVDLLGRDGFVGGEPLQASRLYPVKRSLLGDGFTLDAVYYFLNCHKLSTRAQYQSTWSRFLSFLDAKQVLPGKLRLCHVFNLFG